MRPHQVEDMAEDDRQSHEKPLPGYRGYECAQRCDTHGSGARQMQDWNQEVTQDNKRLAARCEAEKQFLLVMTRRF